MRQIARLVSGVLSLGLGDNLDAGWTGHLSQANSDWNESAVLNNSLAAAGANNPIDCTPNSGRVEVCNSAYGENGWLAIAGIYISKGEQITRAYVKLNDTYFNQAAYNTPSWRQMVMCQEVGHTFGFAHQDENFSNINLGT